jgi:hypothetical protein
MGKRTWLIATLAAVLALASGAALAIGQDYGDHGGHAEGGGGGGGGGGSSAQAGVAKRNLFANLTGRKELDAEGDKGAGDLDGRGGSTVTIDGSEVCWGITSRNITEVPIAAHIHQGKRSVNGPIVVTLSPPLPGDPGASSGCQTEDAELLEDIQRHPKRYYVNVHTTDFPGGAIRGQLFGKRK